ncbi:hypothetical protein [Klebsiella quasipneumoniae]|uniref:hypothetical protein n=1 Tax=Klebsiella quasipneumoniae TaxID=1463165 RepID=UPI002E76B5AB|nr:hypothetical protein [Klebsiella quasipneumoniae]
MNLYRVEWLENGSVLNGVYSSNTDKSAKEKFVRTKKTCLLIQKITDKKGVVMKKEEYKTIFKLN